MAALDVTYMFVGTTPLKAVTSLLFVAIGVVNMVFALRNGKREKFVFALPAALAVAMIGDVAINFDFIAGAAVFALGHVVYVIAYFFLNGFKPKDLIFAACVFVPSVLIITLVPSFDFGGILLEIVCVAYALILSAMTGKAISDCVSKRSLLSIVIMVGSILFFTSDLALLINEFMALSKAGAFATRVLCLATYYPAQFLLAFSVFVYAVRGSSGEKGDAEKTENAVE